MKKLLFLASLLLLVPLHASEPDDDHDEPIGCPINHLHDEPVGK